MTEHPTEELAALVHGELTLAELQSVVRHLRGCRSCQEALVEVAAATGALRRVDHDGLADVAEPVDVTPVREVEAPDRPAVRRRGSRAVPLVAAAAVVVVLAVAAVAVGMARRSGDAPGSGPVASVALAPVGTAGASGVDGVVSMAGSGGDATVMTVSTSLPAAPSGSFYEVWLLQPTTGQMVAVGVLPDGGRASYSVPTDLVGRYQAVDVSLQPDNGVTTHSDQSVLRAAYA